MNNNNKFFELKKIYIQIKNGTIIKYMWLVLI